MGCAIDVRDEPQRHAIDYIGDNGADFGLGVRVADP